MAEMKNSAPPQWMGPWLKTRMYGEGCKCQKHGGSYTTVFCGECLGRPHCQKCWHTGGESKPHRNHGPILQAFIASKRTAIRVENIREVCKWDVSDIQVYKINHTTILHLEPNKSASGSKRPRVDDQNPRCRNCTRKLIESDFSFCSIACKYNYVTNCLNEGIEERPRTNVIRIRRQRVIPQIVPQQSSTEPINYRRRSRKGVPVRAPFF